LRLDDVDAIVARTEGVSAAFVKELLRRAALIAATATATSSDPPSGPLVVGDGQMNLALDEMLGDGDRLTRAILGAAIAHDGPEAGLRPPRVEAPPHLGSP
jgi:hypothetical protein